MQGDDKTGRTGLLCAWFQEVVTQRTNALPLGMTMMGEEWAGQVQHPSDTNDRRAALHGDLHNAVEHLKQTQKSQ